MRTRALIIGTAIALGCAAAILTPRLEAPADAFVRASGARLTIAGQPFRFVGANVAVMHGDEQREHMEETLDAAAADGMRVVRVWAFGEAEAGAPWARARSYAFRVGEERWVEESFVHLDRVLAAARARGLRVILVLANRWDDYGGIPRYLAWTEPEATPIDPLVEADLTPFWRSDRAAALYLAHVERLVTRVSSVDGTRYADDPTILSWELFNEAAAAEPAHDAMLGFVDRAVRLIRRFDRAHLIGVGHGGFYDAAGRSLWTRVHRLPEVGYYDVHAYPQHDPSIVSFDRLAAWMDARTVLARDKPLVWGEIGIPARHPRLAPRAAWLDAFSRRAFATEASGVLVWIYGPRSSSPHRIAPGDPASAAVRAVLAAQAARLWPTTPRRSVGADRRRPRARPEPSAAPLRTGRRR